MADAPIEPNLPATQQSKLDIAVRTANVIGRLIGKGIFLSKRSSELWAEHQGRLASIEIAKAIAINESKISTEVRADLLRSAATAEPVQRAQIMATLVQVDSHIRTVNIGAQAIKHLEDTTLQGEGQSQHETSQPNHQTEVTDHWLDTFLQFARIRSEPWRQDLLARALALESRKPGDVGTVVLWAIGQLSEETFHAYSHFLDMCIVRREALPFLPDIEDNLEILTAPVPNCVLGERNYGNLLPVLEESNLIYPIMPLGGGTTFTFKKGALRTFCYGGRNVTVIWKKDTSIHAIYPTSIGISLAQLYDVKHSAGGSERFSKWIMGLGDLIELVSDSSTTEST